MAMLDIDRFSSPPLVRHHYFSCQACVKSTRSAKPVKLSSLDTVHLYVHDLRSFASRRNNDVSYFAIQVANAGPHGNDASSRVCTLVNHLRLCQCGSPSTE